MTHEEVTTLLTCRDHPAIRGIVKLLRERMRRQHAMNKAKPELCDEIRKDLRTGLGREWELEEVLEEIESIWKGNDP